MAVAIEQRTIAQLPEIIDGLEGNDRSLVCRMVEVNTTIGEFDPGSLPLSDLERQLLIEPYNPWNHRRVIFNTERAKRLPEPRPLTQIEAEIKRTLRT